MALPFTVILLLCIFRPSICWNRCRKKTDDASGTENTETTVSRQRLHDDRNSSTSIGADRDMEAETEAGLPTSDLASIPALPRKTSIFSIHEGDEDMLGNTFHSFVPEARSAPESDYDQLPIARKPLETTAAVASDAGDDEDDQPEYVNVLEARDGHNQNDQEEYTNFPAISI